MTIGLRVLIEAGEVVAEMQSALQGVRAPLAEALTDSANTGLRAG